jgi:hypothetical protein
MAGGRYTLVYRQETRRRGPPYITISLGLRPPSTRWTTRQHASRVGAPSSCVRLARCSHARREMASAASRPWDMQLQATQANALIGAVSCNAAPTRRLDQGSESAAKDFPAPWRKTSRVDDSSPRRWYLNDTSTVLEKVHMHTTRTSG